MWQANEKSANMKLTGAAVLFFAIGAPVAGDPPWVFVDETATRIVASPEVATDDHEEKDMAVGDVDMDGDMDLVVVRKQPYTTMGRRRNVLFMNEGGVMVDRTAEYATEADDGGQGFLDLTNDRDVELVDVNGDGWLDIVTATTLSHGLPQTISHPRVYINNGEVDGVWQGFRYEQARIPTLPEAPHFCSVAAGDVTRNGTPDLYFADYENDLEDRLLINDGNGYFTDETAARLTPGFQNSYFGTASEICDLNGDGWGDIIKNNALGSAPPYFGIGIYHFPNDQTGYFDDGIYQDIHDLDSLCYYFDVGDLNNDNRLDVFIVKDSQDRAYYNTGTQHNGLITAEMRTISSSRTTGFGGNVHMADLDRDGDLDVGVADIDVDIPGCNREMTLLENMGNMPYPDLVDPFPSTQDQNYNVSTFDFAFIDINGDGWLDIWQGTCTGTQVLIQQPPCLADLDGDGNVGAADLALLLGSWGPCPDPCMPGSPVTTCAADLSGDCSVEALDLAMLLGGWGPCP